MNKVILYFVRMGKILSPQRFEVLCPTDPVASCGEIHGSMGSFSDCSFVLDVAPQSHSFVFFPFVSLDAESEATIGAEPVVCSTWQRIYCPNGKGWALLCDHQNWALVTQHASKLLDQNWILDAEPGTSRPNSMNCYTLS